MDYGKDFRKYAMSDFNMTSLQMDFHIGNAYKYIARAGKKGVDKEIQDLQKAIWYIERKIQLLENGIGESN